MEIFCQLIFFYSECFLINEELHHRKLKHELLFESTYQLLSTFRTIFGSYSRDFRWMLTNNISMDLSSIFTTDWTIDLSFYNITGIYILARIEVIVLLHHQRIYGLDRSPFMFDHFFACFSLTPFRNIYHVFHDKSFRSFQFFRNCLEHTSILQQPPLYPSEGTSCASVGFVNNDVNDKNKRKACFLYR